MFINERRIEQKLTIYAPEVEEVGSAVHLVELKAHLCLHGSDRVLPSHTQVVRIDHLQVLSGRIKNLVALFATVEKKKKKRGLTFHS